MFLVPDFKGFDFFPHGTHIDFMRWKAICLGLSLAMTTDGDIDSTPSVDSALK